MALGPTSVTSEPLYSSIYSTSSADEFLLNDEGKRDGTRSDPKKHKRIYERPKPKQIPTSSEDKQWMAIPDKKKNKGTERSISRIPKRAFGQHSDPSESSSCAGTQQAKRLKPSIYIPPAERPLESFRPASSVSISPLKSTGNTTNFRSSTGKQRSRPGPGVSSSKHASTTISEERERPVEMKGTGVSSLVSALFQQFAHNSNENGSRRGSPGVSTATRKGKGRDSTSRTSSIHGDTQMRSTVSECKTNKPDGDNIINEQQPSPLEPSLVNTQSQLPDTEKRYLYHKPQHPKMAAKSAIAEETSIKKVLSGEYESPWGRVGSYKPLNDLKATPRCVKVRSEDKVRGKRMKDNTKGDDGKDEERAMLHGTIKPKKEKTRAERYIFLLKEYYGEGDIWRGHMKRKPTSYPIKDANSDDIEFRENRSLMRHENYQIEDDTDSSDSENESEDEDTYFVPLSDAVSPLTPQAAQDVFTADKALLLADGELIVPKTDEGVDAISETVAIEMNDSKSHTAETVDFKQETPKILAPDLVPRSPSPQDPDESEDGQSSTSVKNASNLLVSLWKDKFGEMLTHGTPKPIKISDLVELNNAFISLEGLMESFSSDRHALFLVIRTIKDYLFYIRDLPEGLIPFSDQFELRKRASEILKAGRCA